MLKYFSINICFTKKMPSKPEALSSNPSAAKKKKIAKQLPKAILKESLKTEKLEFIF
jgi:hypothetical protein